MKRIFFTFAPVQLPKNAKLINLIEALIGKSSFAKIYYKWYLKDLSISKDFKIYEKGVQELLRSDLILAEASTPSIGVGQQIAFGIYYKIPIIVLVKKELEYSPQSAFLKSTQSSFVNFFYYEDINDLRKNLIPLIKSKLDDTLEKLNFIATRKLKKYLVKESKKRSISQSELIRLIINEWKQKRRES